MPPSYTEWKQRSGESVGTVHNPSFETALGMIKTAAVSFEHLTNDPHWDRFLSYMQEQYEENKKARAMYSEGCAKAMTDEGIRACQMSFARADAKVEVLEFLLGLPHQLMESYGKVKV